MSVDTERRPFKAKYDGRCNTCGDTIQAGDLLEYDLDDRVSHSECLRDATTSDPSRPTCPRCFQVPSRTGACGCDPEDQETRP